jgi:hypothetical protein
MYMIVAGENKCYPVEAREAVDGVSKQRIK